MQELAKVYDLAEYRKRKECNEYVKLVKKRLKWNDNYREAILSIGELANKDEFDMLFNHLSEKEKQDRATVHESFILLEMGHILMEVDINSGLMEEINK